MMKTALFALLTVLTVSLSSCSGDKNILAENAQSMDETLSGNKLSFFGVFDGVDYDADANKLSFYIKEAEVNPGTIKNGFDSFGPVLFKHLFYNYEKRRALIAQKVKALNTNASFEISPRKDGGEKAIIDIPAAKYAEINNLVFSPDQELEARVSVKDQLYGLPMLLEGNEKVTDVAFAEGKFIVTIAISPESFASVAKNEVYYKQHGIEIIQSRMHDDGALCAEGSFPVILRYVGSNGNGSADVELSPTVVASRLR